MSAKCHKQTFGPWYEMKEAANCGGLMWRWAYRVGTVVLVRRLVSKFALGPVGFAGRRRTRRIMPKEVPLSRTARNHPYSAWASPRAPVPISYDVIPRTCRLFQIAHFEFRLKSLHNKGLEPISCCRPAAAVVAVGRRVEVLQVQVASARLRARWCRLPPLVPWRAR